LSSKKVRVLFVIISALALFFLSPFITNDFVSAAVVINEIYPKTEPASLSWIELYNNGTESVSLDRWSLQNSEGSIKTFVLNASVIIAGQTYVTFPGSQTNITFSISGDTLKLFDEKNNLVDSKSYPSTLGYNTSMGLNSDGGNIWSICTIPTYNSRNTCPPPFVNPTSLPTNSETPISTKPLSTSTPNLTPIPSIQPSIFLKPTPTTTRIIETADYIFPTPSPDPTSIIVKIDKLLVSKILLVAMVIGVVYIVMYILRSNRTPPTIT